MLCPWIDMNLLPFHPHGTRAQAPQIRPLSKGAQLNTRSPGRILVPCHGYVRGILMGLLVLLAWCSPCRLPGQAVPEDLKLADAAFHAGYAALKEGNLEAARTQFAAVVRLAPQIPEGHEALAQVLIELNDAPAATTEFEAALKLKPGDPAIEANLAQSYAKAGDPAKGIPYFKTIFEASQEPGHPPVDASFCEAYARALAASGDPAQAIQMFQVAMDRGGAKAGLFDAIGSLYAQAGNWSQAQPAFERALAIDNSYVLARIHLGIVQRQQNNLTASLASLEKAVSDASSNPLAQFEYGRSLEAAGQDDAAIPHLEEAAKLAPEMPGVDNQLAMTLQRQGRQQEAIPWFQKAIERDPHRRQLLYEPWPGSHPHRKSEGSVAPVSTGTGRLAQRSDDLQRSRGRACAAFRI